jgi:L-alanine-DL-glutamate epimerase-like enolase superfamily enzyme
MQLRFRRFDLQLTRTWRIASGGDAGTDTYGVVLMELTDVEGRRGLGEAASTQRYHQPVEVIEQFLGKVDPRRLSFGDVPASMRYLDELAPRNSAAKCGLNLALLDGAARSVRRPVYELLQLGFREEHHVTSFSLGIDTPEMIRRKTLEAADYPVLKLKIGSATDLENLAALRDAAPAKPVRVDANEAWTDKETALRNLEWLARDGRIQFVEQPMPATTPPADLAWLKQRSPLPLCADESYHVAADLAAVSSGFHMVNVKLVKTGGMTGAVEALRAAREAGLKTMIGCMIETSVGITAAAHLAELADYLDLDGNLLITNDPYRGVSAAKGVLSFATAPEPFGLRVKER